MTMATTATRAEVVTAYVAMEKAVVALRQIVDGSATPALPGRNTAAEVDTMLTAVTASITAIDA